MNDQLITIRLPGFDFSIELCYEDLFFSSYLLIEIEDTITLIKLFDTGCIPITLQDTVVRHHANCMMQVS